MIHFLTLSFGTEQVAAVDGVNMVDEESTALSANTMGGNVGNAEDALTNSVY